MVDVLGKKRYSSKIIKAGALLPDTKLLLEIWDTDTDVKSNLERVREENLLGKASRSRVEDVLRVFRQYAASGSSKRLIGVIAYSVD